jgi:hypothetical protein
MTLTIKFLNEMFRIWGDHIDKPLEAYLSATYEEEPFPYEWSEQDLYEQIRKLIFQYEQGKLDISVQSLQERQRMRYDALKESYLELLGEVTELQDTISGAVKLLGKTNHISGEDTLIPF